MGQAANNDWEQLKDILQKPFAVSAVKYIDYSLWDHCVSDRLCTDAKIQDNVIHISVFRTKAALSFLYFVQ